MNNKKKEEHKALEFIPYNRLRELRMNESLNQSYIADEIGISTIAYGRYERRERQIPGNVLSKLSDYYHVSMDYIYYKTDFKTPPKYQEPPYNVPIEILRAAEKRK